MTSPPGATLAFPSGRALAGWWRQLSPGGESAGRAPAGLWIGHFLLHCVEAPVRLSVCHHLDPFALAALRAVALEGGATAAALGACLHLGSSLLLRLLRELEAEGLLATASDCWALTPLGREAADRGEIRQPGQGRRTFHFVEPWAPVGPRSGGGPRFLALKHATGTPWPAAEGWEFDPALLADAVGRPADWKERHDFPADVAGLVDGDGTAAWERVILDRREHFLAVFALVPAPAASGGEPRLLGFSVRQEGWVLDAERPAFALGASWQEVLPELTHEPPPEAWLQAWRVWCQPRSLPPRDVDACRVERHRHLLRVQAPRSLVERLRAARSDAVKGEAWLLAGTGSVRTAALVELHEA